MIYCIIPFSIFLAFSLPIFSLYWPTIYKEAIPIGAVIVYLFFNKNKIAINKLNVFVISFVVIVIITYFLSAKYFQSSLIAILYSLLAILIISAFSFEENDYQLKLICYSIIAAALFNFLIQVSQAGFWNSASIALPLKGDRFYANLGQANHMGTVFVLSISSLFFLQPQKKVSKFLSIFLSILFAFGLYLTQSRTGLLSLSIMFLISLLRNDSRRFALWNIIPSFFAAILFFNYFKSRDFLDSDGGSGRIDIWLLLLKAIWHEKWIGYGIGNNVIAQFINANTFQREIFGHSHNVIIDFLIWFGVPLGLILSILYISIYFDKAILKERYIKNVLVLMPIAVHSFLEYPLSYFYFLLIFLVFASPIYSEKTISIEFPVRIKRIICGLVLTIFASVLIDYIKITFTYKIQANNINLNFPLDDQFEVSSFFLDEYAVYTNLLKRAGGYTSEDYESLKFLIQKNPINFNFEKLESLAYMYNDEATLNLLKNKKKIFLK